MGLAQLLRRQWNGYSGSHCSRTNLMLHIAVVPLFLIGNMGLVVAFVQSSPALFALSLSCMVISIAAQGRGHRLEAQPPEPFTGPTNAVLRIFVEQWITFPRFVLSGSFARAMRRRDRHPLGCQGGLPARTK